jgi:hypothetical protein
MTEQRLVVDVTDTVLRLQCQCGSAISVALDKIKKAKDKQVTDALYSCPNCEKTFPGIGGPGAGAPVSTFVNALQALTEADLAGCHVQFEVKSPLS